MSKEESDKVMDMMDRLCRVYEKLCEELIGKKLGKLREDDEAKEKIIKEEKN